MERFVERSKRKNSDKQSKAKESSETSDIVVVRVTHADNEIEIDTSDTTAIPSTSAMQNEDNVNRAGNPWPFVENYFKFVSMKGQNAVFDCILCLPAKKTISSNIKSTFNLKKHVIRLHPTAVNDFTKCLEDGTKDRKREHSEDRNETAAKKKPKQVSLQQAYSVYSHSCKQKVTQATVDKKIVSLFVNTMIPLEVRHL